MCGPFATNTYLGLLLEDGLGVAPSQLAGVLMGLGVLGFFGNLIGGYGADHWNRERFIAAILAVLVACFALISIGAQIGGAMGAATTFAGLSIFGLIGWAFPAAQQARLVALDPALAPITLSLNTSALYIGAAVGSTLGGLAIRQWSIGAIGWTAALCESAALAFLLTTLMRAGPRSAKAPRPAAEPATAEAR